MCYLDRTVHELGILEQVRILSTVSGGSVIGALYAAHEAPFEDFEQRVRAVLRQGLARATVRAAFTTTEGVKALICWALLGSINLLFIALKWALWLATLILPTRLRPRGQIAGWHLPFRRFASRTTIFQRAVDHALFKGRRLGDLKGRSPLLIVNAAELRTGSAFYFTPRESGSWRLGRLGATRCKPCAVSM